MSGDLLTVPAPPETPYLVQYRDVLIGDGDPWVILGVTGIGDRALVGPVVKRALAGGDAHGTFTLASGAVSLTFQAGTGDPATMEETFATLAAEVPTTPIVEPEELHLVVPGRGHIYVVGFVSELAQTRSFAGGGVGASTLTFQKVDPAEYEVPDP